jgi:hypothetical protein
MNRHPPIEVRRALRREVGFGCPVKGCSNPYLGYHHFDPPWSKRHHHDPKGMVALCAEHHSKADTGAFTMEQLRALKKPNESVVVGRFDWLRNKMLSVVGGNFYYETPIPVQFRGKPQVWYTRDDQGYLLLNLRMVSASCEPRLCLDKNDWIILGDPSDFESPPSGRLIAAKYTNGDELRVEFFELLTVVDAIKRYTAVGPDSWADIKFPITAVEIQNLVGVSNIGFGPFCTKLGGVAMTGNFMSHCSVGLSW